MGACPGLCKQAALGCVDYADGFAIQAPGPPCKDPAANPGIVFDDQALPGNRRERIQTAKHGKTEVLRKLDLVPPERFEHAAYGLGNRRSIRLSYGGIAGTGIAGPRAGQSSVS